MAAASSRSSARFFRETWRDLRWYHWAGGAATCGAFNASLLLVMGEGYRFYDQDSADSKRRFRERYGLPTEQQRLDLFRYMAPRWDETIAKVEQSSADNYRRELFGTGDVRGSVLEVGMGTGRCFEAMKAAAEQCEEPARIQSYVGIDCIDEMLEIARAKLPDLPFVAKVELADAHRLPFPDASFDTVMSCLCLCSVERPQEALAEMARVCRPADEGGSILILEPGLARSWTVRVAQRYLRLVPNPMHAWETGWYDDLDVEEMVKNCPTLELQGLTTRAMGNWYLVRATPRQHRDSRAAAATS